MISQIFLSLWRRRSQSIFASGGFLVAACALILLSATTQTTTLRANQLIAQNWRPSYDLVVLPSGAQFAQGQAVPADTLEGYNGGISLRQYAQVQQTPGVEVAAPIAFIGYVQLPPPTIEFASGSLTPGYYKVNWTLTAFNGQRQIVERQVSFMYGVLSDCGKPHAFDSLRQQHILIESCGLAPDAQSSGFLAGSIDTGTFLLAAIDPVAENQLLHLDQGLVQGRLLSPQDKLTAAPPPPIPTAGGNPPGYEIPLLFHQNLPGQISLHATFSHVTDQQPTPQDIEAHGGFNYLDHLPGQQVLFDGSVPLVQNDPQRFSNATLSWNGQTWQPISAQSYGVVGNAMRFLYTPSGLTYQQMIGPDGKPAYGLVASDVQKPGAVLDPRTLTGQEDDPATDQGPEPFFRTLHPLLTSQPNATYFARPVGQFVGEQLNAQFSNELNWLPESTYAAPPVTLQYDAQGRPVSPTTILPTTNPAGMTLQPPLALTTLAAATQLKGDQLISVIRVRVSGVNGANDASWKRIQQVAQSIERNTGLHALVTLGSSPAPTLVYVPGLQPGQHGSTRAIDPLGWVRERWIAIGVSLLYLGQVGQLQLLLLGALLTVCLGYLMVTLSSLLTSQRRELAILSALGWRPWQPTRLFLGQVTALALGGGLGGMGIALLVSLLIGVSPSWPVLLLTLPAILLLATLSALYPLWQLRRVRPAEILRAGTAVGKSRTFIRRRMHALLSPLALMAWQNLARKRGRSLVALGSFFLSALLLMVMLDGLLAFREALQGTLLGNFVLLQTAVPQLAGALFALLLTFSSVANLLLLQVRERWHEIGLLQALGWRPAFIYRLLVQEGLTLAIAGTIPGVLVAGGILYWLHSAQSNVALPLVATGTILLMALVAVLGTFPALRAVNRVHLVEVMRAE
ncbi:MAG TPA: FtsX-like permease family protein [Ktedonosporobacter sp.]|jgi:hypothetical protein|nr:FtsX-like permease family protein [Ktedonosporobacter sp.]